MRPATDTALPQVTRPVFIAKAHELSDVLQTLSPAELKKMMHVSDSLAHKTQDLLTHWSDAPAKQRAAIDSFLGDIYSGLQVATLTDDDRTYAQEHLRILSGMYGLLRPLDGIYPYRLEMGYALPSSDYKNLYAFWGDRIAKSLPAADDIVDLSALEYSKVITPYIDQSRLVRPQFLTISPKTHQPTFVVVHAKIARGAYAHWMIQHRIKDVAMLKDFNDLGYVYNHALSTPLQPTFVCQEFGGIGLSVRLT